VEKARVEAEQRARLEAMAGAAAPRSARSRVSSTTTRRRSLRNMLIGISGVAVRLIGGGVLHRREDDNESKAAERARRSAAAEALEEEKRKLEKQMREQTAKVDASSPQL
jgi:colicin import membrane protein